MHNRIITNSIRSIKKSISRFIPLFIMSFLGVFVYAGLESTKPDMLTTLDNNLDKQNIYDIKIVSTLGLTDDDIDALKKIEGIKNVSGSYSADVLIKDSNNDIVINIASISSKINNITLLDGHFPSKENEIVVEQNFLTKTSYNLNDTINIENDNFKTNTFKIVGVVKSNLYFNNDKLNQDRGSTTIGMGTINFYTYVLEDAFNTSYYHNIYLTINNAKELMTSSKEYDELIKKSKNDIEKIKNEREEARYKALYEEIDNAIKEQEEKGNKELNKVKKQLNNTKAKLNTTNNELANSLEKLNEYNNTLLSFKENLDNSYLEYQNLLTKYTLKEENLESMLKDLENEKKLLEEKIQNNNDENDILLLAKINEQINNLESILQLKNVLSSKKQLYEKELDNYLTQKEAYETGLSVYQNGLNKYNQGLKEYNKEKNNFVKEINNAKEERDNLEKPIWYIYDRYDYQTYTDYIDDITSVDNLSKIFPLVFFAVAILISLISMNRMVEDERIEIGTFKSLGFSNKHIMIKYLLFAFSATITGGLFGGFLGIYIIPNLIFNIYSMLFNVPAFKISLNLSKIIISIIISLVCICGTTMYTVLKVVKEKPAELMRQKAPKKGKRIILEKIKWLWKRLNFSHKITLRNMLRYKKRGIVTIIGIAGCSSLLLCGFGIRDAIIDIADKEYYDIFKYDALVYVNDYKNDLFNMDEITNRVEAENIKVKENNVVANLVVVDKDEVHNVINLIAKNGKALKLEKNKVIVTDKFAELNNLEIGDYVNLIDDNNKSYKYEISGIATNYLMHYVFIDKTTFKEENTYNTNMVYLKLHTMEIADKNKFASQIRNYDEVLNVTFIEDLLEATDNMLKSLNKVVIIIIVLSASLSFVVLYNLSSINITERKREISTLKVLGFYDHEVDNYITKENIILTIIGIGIGLFIGYFLTKIVIITVEIEKARFLYHINFNSYIYTTLITIFFTLLVNLVMHFSLKKVDMIGSLKSVD